jgi:hypothetical protein
MNKMKNEGPDKRPKLKIAFSDFIFNHHTNDKLSGFNPQRNYFTEVLNKIYTVEVSSFEDADILFYSVFGNKHREFSRRKIFYTSENVLPDFEECDFAITFCHLPNEPKHYRLPQYVLYVEDINALLKSPKTQWDVLLKSKIKFANFIVSNPRSLERNRFFRMLNRRKKVDSGGRHFNNLGRLVDNKIEFIKDYKFTLAFENSSSPGYTTEKIVEAMMAGSIPIYWGNPDVAKDFNPKSFINVTDFPSFEAAINHILEIDCNDELYLSYLREPWFNQNQIPPWFNTDKLALALRQFIESPWAKCPRIYKNRGLRDHVNGTGLLRHLSSFTCKLDSLLWKIGWR